MATVLAIGELLADLITTDHVDDLSHAKSFTIYQGGSPANVCANLKWLGTPCNLVSAVGNDGIGHFIKSELQKTGLITDYIHTSNIYPTSLVLVGKSKATPDFVAYRLADTQIEEISNKLLNDAKIIHTSAFALSKEPARTNILNAVDKATADGKLFSIDWNFAPRIWGNDNGRLVFEKVCSYKPLVKFSMDDVIRFSGKNLLVTEAKYFLDEFTYTAVCLTCGKEGVWYKHDGEWQFAAAHTVNAVKDTTGAGDAFWSGFLHAWLQQKNMADCIYKGLEVAALKIQKTGPLYL
jgi:fructokinase